MSSAPEPQKRSRRLLDDKWLETRLGLPEGDGRHLLELLSDARIRVNTPHLLRLLGEADEGVLAGFPLAYRLAIQAYSRGTCCALRQTQQTLSRAPPIRTD